MAPAQCDWCSERVAGYSRPYLLQPNGISANDDCRYGKVGMRNSAIHTQTLTLQSCSNIHLCHIIPTQTIYFRTPFSGHLLRSLAFVCNRSLVITQIDIILT